MVDGRNALSVIELVDAGFAYASFGRGIRGRIEVPATAQLPATVAEAGREATSADAPAFDVPAGDGSPVERHRSGASGLDLALTD